MKPFMDSNFMLENETAKELFKYARDMPIFDWHCHLSPKEIWKNKNYDNITQVWLGGDHYKWRALRSLGIPEEKITGDSSDREKFDVWAAAMPYLIGNPLYHWTHLELQRYFGIQEPLDTTTADAVWNKTKDLLAKPEFSPRGLIEQSNVVAVCTTDDPADSLEYHQKIRDEGKMKTKIIPAMRPDKALRIAAPGYPDYLKKLGTAANISISSFADLTKALQKRIDFFAQMGCVACDHAFEKAPFCSASASEVEAIFQKGLAGKPLTDKDIAAYETALMLFLSAEYQKHNWVMEIHIGAIRDNNRAMFDLLGPDTGYDSVGDDCNAKALARLLNAMDTNHTLPKTILFNLNPKDNFVFGALMGCFQSAEAASKVQLGAAWWFLDHEFGMTEQLKTFAVTGVLSKFVGMVTDSRSFLSYPRHEYFRRILCNLLGTWVEQGKYPKNDACLKEIVQGISYENAAKFFSLKV